MIKTVNSVEKRYKKIIDSNKDVILTFRTLEDGSTKEVHFLNFRETPDRPSKRRDRFCVKQLAEKGYFKGILSPDDIQRALTEGVVPDPYVVDYKIPLDLGGSGTVGNMYVVDRYVAELMEHLYWKQIRMEIQALQMRSTQQKKRSRIGVSFARLPRVFTQEDFLNYIMQHERKELQKYLIKKKRETEPLPKKVVFQYFSNNELLLRLIVPEKVPQGMKMAIIKVSPRQWDDRSRLRGDYTHSRAQIALASLQRGDFDAWPEELRKKIISSGGHVPSVAHVTCHHILPLLLGGDNKVKNVCWLNDKVHENIHNKFIAPLESCLYGMEQKPSKLFFEMPVPEGASIQTYSLVNGELQPNPIPESAQLLKTLQKLSLPPAQFLRRHKRTKKKNIRRHPSGSRVSKRA